MFLLQRESPSRDAITTFSDVVGAERRKKSANKKSPPSSPTSVASNGNSLEGAIEMLNLEDMPTEPQVCYDSLCVCTLWRVEMKHRFVCLVFGGVNYV